jgi:shikimate dehydrogenase
MNAIAAVIGHPIGHSLSPDIHNYWLKLANIRGEYRAHDVAPDRLSDAVKKFADEGYVGLNVTLPHKEAVMTLCDDLSDAARAIGAVNTIVFANDKIYGDNTDAVGFADNLVAADEDKIFDSAIILGAGGAARAVCFALKNLGVLDFTILNRDVARAEKLLTELSLAGTAAPLKNNGSAQHDQADILVNCTSLGMTGQPPLPFNLGQIGKHTIVADIVYKPLQTEFLKAAHKRGCKTVDGLGMLIHQAAAAFEQFYGVEAGEMIKLREILERRLA